MPRKDVSRVDRTPPAPTPDGYGPAYALERLQRTAGNAAVHSALAIGGAVRADLEERLGEPLPDARVHAGQGARDVLSRENALGLTRGRDVFLVPGLEVDSQAGRAVLAHELAHVVQQTATGSSWSAGDLEAEAATVGTGTASSVIGAASFGSVQKVTMGKHIRGLLERDQTAWKRLLDDPNAARIMRELPPSAYRDDPEFQQWLKDDRYRPPGWTPGPQVAQAEARERGPAAGRGTGAGAPAQGRETILSGDGVDVVWDEAEKRYVISVDGSVVGGIDAPSRTAPVEFSVAREGANVWLDAGGTRTPLTGPAAAPFSEFAMPAAPPPRQAQPRRTPEEIAKENWERNTTPRQKVEAASLPRPPIYYTKEMRELDAPPEVFEAVDMFLPFPAMTTGWKAPQLVTGETLSGIPVDKGKLAKEIGEDIVVSIVLDQAVESTLGRLAPDDVIEQSIRHGDEVVDDAARGAVRPEGSLPVAAPEVPPVTAPEIKPASDLPTFPEKPPPVVQSGTSAPEVQKPAATPEATSIDTPRQPSAPAQKLLGPGREVGISSDFSPKEPSRTVYDVKRASTDPDALAEVRFAERLHSDGHAVHFTDDVGKPDLIVDGVRTDVKNLQGGRFQPGRDHATTIRNQIQRAGAQKATQAAIDGTGARLSRDQALAGIAEFEKIAKLHPGPVSTVERVLFLLDDGSMLIYNRFAPPLTVRP